MITVQIVLICALVAEICRNGADLFDVLTAAVLLLSAIFNIREERNAK